jgi:hypothetical protein
VLFDMFTANPFAQTGGSQSGSKELATRYWPPPEQAGLFGAHGTTDALHSRAALVASQDGRP